jgi:transposase InsO family protein
MLFTAFGTHIITSHGTVGFATISALYNSDETAKNIELDLSERRYSAKQVKTLIFEYIEVYYNRRRRHSALGYVIPVALTNHFVA